MQHGQRLRDAGEPRIGGEADPQIPILAGAQPGIEAADLQQQVAARQHAGGRADQVVVQQRQAQVALRRSPAQAAQLARFVEAGDAGVARTEFQPAAFIAVICCSIFSGSHSSSLSRKATNSPRACGNAVVARRRGAFVLAEGDQGQRHRAGVAVDRVERAVARTVVDDHDLQRTPAWRTTLSIARAIVAARL